MIELKSFPLLQGTTMNLFNEMMRQHFALYQPPKEGETYTKSTIIPTGDGNYRASISYFIDGNSLSITDIKDTLEAAEDFITDRIKRVTDDNPVD